MPTGGAYPPIGPLTSLAPMAQRSMPPSAPIERGPNRHDGDDADREHQHKRSRHPRERIGLASGSTRSRRPIEGRASTPSACRQHHRGTTWRAPRGPSVPCVQRRPFGHRTCIQPGCGRSTPFGRVRDLLRNRAIARRNGRAILRGPVDNQPMHRGPSWAPGDQSFLAPASTRARKSRTTPMYRVRSSRCAVWELSSKITSSEPGNSDW